MIEELRQMGIFFFTIWIITVMILIGAAFNMHALTTNAGKMPVAISDSAIRFMGAGDNYVSINATNKINNYYLSDIIKIRNSYFSLGDVVMLLGIFLMVGLTIFETKNLKGGKNE